MYNILCPQGRNGEIMNIKKFFGNYSYHCVKIFVDQIAIAVFGLALAITTAKANSTNDPNQIQPMTVAVSVGAVIFFLVMAGQIAFRCGVEDREKISLGRFPKNNYTGFLMGIIANIPNLVLAVVYAVFRLFEATGGIAAFANLAMKLIYGEYLGILSIPISGTKLGMMPLSFFLITLPSIIACGIAYYLAVNGIIEFRPTKDKLE